VDTHLLRTFAAVARHRSFSTAAGELGYTQSAVSQHIAALEADLKTPLLHRRPVTLTAAGARLLEHAEPLLLRLAAARADVTRLVAAPAEKLVIGASAPALSGLFATRLAEVRLVEVTVKVLDRATIPARVAEGTLDLGLVDGMAAPADPLPLPDVGPLTAVAVGQEPLVVVLPPGHPLASRTTLRLTDLSDARWIDAPEAAIPLSRLRTTSGTEGFRPSLRYEGTDVRGVAALAAAGHGLALLPASALPASATGVPVPGLLHRVELLHGGLPDGPAALLAAALTN
jgi:DNA-binding transcriptional LysR family regulator